ncbi:MAG: MBL fold metallo-hydrolase [Clostridia bacterium]|nr:MBL fold metallo-hydrolase [Clostridia bacterium]
MKIILASIIALLIIACLYLKGYIFVTSNHISDNAAKLNMNITDPENEDEIYVQHIRHATVMVSINSKKILIDPMISDVNKLPPVPLTSNRLRNPMVPLPVNISELQHADAILITHYHFDHFDTEAQKFFPKDIQIFCQPADENKLRKHGFKKVTAVEKEFVWENLLFGRFDANHGTGLLGKIMGNSSSFLISNGKKSVFISGDALYDKALRKTLNDCKPDIIVANAGEARMLFGKPITMNTEDIVSIADTLPYANIITVHMDAINHCGLTRNNLREYLKKRNMLDRIAIPEDGETLRFAH